MHDMSGAPRAVWTFAEHEHRELVRGINHIHDVACGTSDWVASEVSVRLLDVLAWLDREFDPHMAWEESWLYPEIDARTGTPWATRSARFDHQQIRDMEARLKVDQQLLHEEPRRARMPELRCHLFGLEALLRAHIEREERFLIPLLADDAWVEPPVKAGRPVQTG